MPTIKKYATDTELGKALAQFRAEQGYTNSKLAKIFGSSTTFISKYINDKLDREDGGFTEKAWDILKALKQRIAFENELFENSITRQIHGRINFIRKTSDIALLFSAAGLGKSSSARLYVEKNPSSVYVELNAMTRCAKKLESAIFNAVENRDWNGFTSRFNYLVERFKGSQRVILIDNGQRLDTSGRTWLFDFHDATNCPIVIIANPEVLDKVEAVDQHLSRIGICKGIDMDPKSIHASAVKVAAQFSDEETAAEIEDLVTIVAKNEGHLRSVRKQVILMQTIRELQAAFKDKPRDAFRAAHKELVRKYDLPA